MLAIDTELEGFRVDIDTGRISDLYGRQIFDALGKSNLFNCIIQQYESIRVELRDSIASFIFLMRWNGLGRIGSSSKFDVVYAMLVRFRNEIAYRVAVVAFDARDWEAADPVKYRITLD